MLKDFSRVLHYFLDTWRYRGTEIKELNNIFKFAFKRTTWKQLVKKQVFSAYNLSGEASLKIDAFPCFTKCKIFKYLYKQLICSSIHPKELVKLLPKHSMPPKKKSCSHAFMLEMPTCTSLKALKSLKLVSTIFYQIFIFSPNDSPSKTMKNVFYFI